MMRMMVEVAAEKKKKKKKQRLHWGGLEATIVAVQLSSEQNNHVLPQLWPLSRTGGERCTVDQKSPHVLSLSPRSSTRLFGVTFHHCEMVFSTPSRIPLLSQSAWSGHHQCTWPLAQPLIPRSSFNYAQSRAFQVIQLSLHPPTSRRNQPPPRKGPPPPQGHNYYTLRCSKRIDHDTKIWANFFGGIS